jgi:hypothetical protein
MCERERTSLTTAPEARKELYLITGLGLGLGLRLLHDPAVARSWSHYRPTANVAPQPNCHQHQSPGTPLHKDSRRDPRETSALLSTQSDTNAPANTTDLEAPPRAGLQPCMRVVERPPNAAIKTGTARAAMVALAGSGLRIQVRVRRCGSVD